MGMKLISDRFDIGRVKPYWTAEDAGIRSTGGNDAYAKLLLHCNGADGSVIFTDESPSAHGNATVVATAQVDTAQKKFGTGSLLCDGNSDYIYFGDSADWNFGDGDFTIDFWCRFPSYTKQGFFSQYVDGNNFIEFYNLSADNVSYFDAYFEGNPVARYSMDWTPSNDIWYHVAIVRDGTSFFIFIDGVSQSLTVTVAISTNSLPDLAATWNIGYCQTIAVGWLNGWIDEFRISKGIARWVSNFTPPTEEYHT